MNLITFLSASLRFLQGLTFFFFALILREKGLDGLHIGVLLSTYTLTPILLSLPAGILNDRFHSRGLLALSLAGSSLFYAILVHTSSFALLLPAFFTGGASTNLAAISLQSLALKSAGKGRKSARLGVFQGSTYMGFGLGLLAGGFLLDQKSASFLLSSTSFAFLALIVPAAFLHKTSRVRLDLLEYLSEFRKPGVLLFCASYSLFALHWGAEGSSYGLFLRDYFHLTKLQSGIFMGLPILGLGISAMFTGHSLDRRRGSLQSLTITAFLCSGLGQVLMVVPNIYLSFVLRIVHEIGDGMAGAILLTEMARRFRIDCIGGQSSLVTLSTILAQSLGLFIFSQTGQHWGHDWSMIAGGLAAAAPVMILLIAGRDAPAPAGAGERAGE